MKCILCDWICDSPDPLTWSGRRQSSDWVIPLWVIELQEPSGHSTVKPGIPLTLYFDRRCCYIRTENRDMLGKNVIPYLVWWRRYVRIEIGTELNTSLWSNQRKLIQIFVQNSNHSEMHNKNNLFIVTQTHLFKVYIRPLLCIKDINYSDTDSSFISPLVTFQNALLYKIAINVNIIQ